MTRNSSDGCWSSDTSSFGWVDMEDTEPAAAKKASTVEHSTSDSDDDSSDDTHFDPECKSRPVLNGGREQKQNRKGNNPESTKIFRGQVKNDASEDSDSTQFEAEVDDRPAVKNTIRSKGNNPLTVKGDQLKSPGTNIASSHETSEDNTSSSDGSDKKDLKPFTKPLLVKKERHSHALSDDSDIDSPPLKTRLRSKSESESSPQRTIGNVNATLVEGVLLDSAQPLPFDIGANEDLWIVQCPNEVSESTLKGKTLNFNGISSAEQFEGRVLLTANPKPVNLLLPKSPLKLKSVTPTGHIIFKDKEMVPHISHPVSNEDTITSLPAGLKQRHPLFGADLSLVQRLSCQLQKRKKKLMKKKKEKQDASDLEPTFCEDENEIMESENSSKFSNGLDTSSLHNKKKKKKIKHLDEQTVAFSQDSDIKNHNLQLSSFHSDSRPRMSSENNKNEFVGSDSFESEPHQKKHRKVKHESFSPEITNAYSELAYVTPSKKRKHKHLEYSFESDRHVTGGTSGETESMLSQKRKKRIYENDVYSTSERTFESSVSFAACSDHISPKKKKHKYERGVQNENTESVNNKYDELATCSQDMTLDPVADELLHTFKKKKKKKKKIKENDTEFEVASNIKTNSDLNCISTKKKKKVKIDNSDEHSEQVRFEARDTTNSVQDFTGADLDYFEDSRKKLWKEERRKLQEPEDLVEFSEEKFSSPITDMYQKKKKKRKSE